MSRIKNDFRVSDLTYPGNQIYYCPNCHETWVVHGSLFGFQWDEVMEMLDAELHTHLVNNGRCAMAVFNAPVGK